MGRPRPFRMRNDNAILMKGWLNPIWYEVAYTVNALFEVEGMQLSILQQDAQAVLGARLPQTAASWGLERWEQELGLPVNPPGVSLEDRRARIMARFLGIGSTVYQLRQIAQAWGYGDIAVMPGIEDWIVYAQFMDARGVPGDLQGHEAELRNNIQAHLGLGLLFRWTLWGEVKNAGLTWCQAKTAGMTGVRPLNWEDIKTLPVEQLPINLECTPESLDPNNPLYGPPPLTGMNTWGDMYESDSTWQQTYASGDTWTQLFERPKPTP